MKTISALLVFTCLGACSSASTSPATTAASLDRGTPAKSAGAYPAQPDVARPDDAGTDLPRLPDDACSLDGYQSFFEAFVEDAALRSRYATPNGANIARNFRIASVDNQWVLIDLHGEPERPVELQLDRMGDVFGATFEAPAVPGQPAERATYRFVFADNCWRLDGLQR